MDELDVVVVVVSGLRAFCSVRFVVIFNKLSTQIGGRACQ